MKSKNEKERRKRDNKDFESKRQSEKSDQGAAERRKRRMEEKTA